MSKFKYDINAKYEPTAIYTLTDLCNKILLNEKNNVTQDYLYDCFYKSRKTSLLSKLITHLDFDMKNICGDNHKEKFDMLKILYLLFEIEKSGLPRHQLEDNLEKRKVLITNILANHSFENLKTVFSSKSVYGVIFNNLYDKIKSQVDDAEKRIEIYEQINFNWHKLAHIYFEKFVISPEAIFHPKETLEEIDKTYAYLKEEILNKLQTAFPLKLPYKEGVMKSFFNILNAHELMCYNFEKTRINNTPIPNPQFLDLYIENNRNMSNKLIKWESIPYIKKNLRTVTNIYFTLDIDRFEGLISVLIENLYTYKSTEIESILLELQAMLKPTDCLKLKQQTDVAINYLKSKNKTKLKSKLHEILNTVEAIITLWFISEFKAIEKSDYTHYEYALKHIKEFSYVFTITRDFDFTEEINFDIFLATIQEIISVKKNGGEIENLYYGRKYNEVYLKNSILDYENYYAVPNLAWITRIENRIAINYGQAKHVQKIRKIENLLYDIKSIIFQYRNLEDLVEVDKFIFNMVERLLTKKEYVIKGERLFNNWIECKLQLLDINFTIIQQPKNERVFDFFREILFISRTERVNIANIIISKIANFYSCKTSSLRVTYNIDVSINNFTIVLSIDINKQNHTMEYIDCQPYLSKEKMRRLSLENFAFKP